MRILIPAMMACTLSAVTAMAASEELRVVEPVGIVRAVLAAEQVTGGRAIEAEFDDDAGGRYEVDVVHGSRLVRVLIDARSGDVGERRKLRMETLWRKLSDRKALQAATAGRPLGELLQSVETTTGGRVTDVSLSTSKGRVFYDVETMTTSGPRSLVVDPASGTALVAAED